MCGKRSPQARTNSKAMDDEAPGYERRQKSRPTLAPRRLVISSTNFGASGSSLLVFDAAIDKSPASRLSSPWRYASILYYWRSVQFTPLWEKFLPAFTYCITTISHERNRPAHNGKDRAEGGELVGVLSFLQFKTRKP